jgi:hypothetical protein
MLSRSGSWNAADIRRRVLTGSACIGSPSSVSVPVTTLFDDETGVLLTPEGIEERFGAVGALDGKRVITY